MTDHTLYPITVFHEDAYDRDGYLRIIRLELEHMRRLYALSSDVRSGDHALCPVKRHPEYDVRAASPSSPKRRLVDIYDRFAIAQPTYGIRPTAAAISETPEKQIAATWRDEIKLSNHDLRIQNAISKVDKLVCVCDEFWAEYHFIINPAPGQCKHRRYSFSEQQVPYGCDLATPCSRYADFSFQSWLTYRAPCEDESPLIIVSAEQWERILLTIMDLIPDHAEIWIVAPALGAQPTHGVSTGFSLPSGSVIYTTDPKPLKSNIRTALDDSLWPKISVVVCSFNQGDYLKGCLTSILGQKYPNLELIVVDGASRDNSIEILKEYQNQISHLIIEPDDGQSDALNKGFARSTGNIMSWVCSDDGLEPGALFQVGKNFVENEVDLIVGGCRRTKPLHGDIAVHHSHLPFDEILTLSFGDLLSFGHTWVPGYYFLQPELFWSRSIWERSGAYIKEHMHFAMDYDLFLRFALAKATLLHIHSPLAFATVHDQQKAAVKGQDIPTVMAMLEEYRDLILKFDR